LAVENDAINAKFLASNRERSVNLENKKNDSIHTYFGTRRQAGNSFCPQRYPLENK
jgi:hypothetical protein